MSATNPISNRSRDDARHGAVDRATISAVDGSDMLGHVLDLPAQLADGRRRMAGADLPAGDAPGGLVVCGMGGSAIGADLASAAIGPRARRPIRVVRDYAPEPWLGADSLVLCASYSGNTEETLEAFELAGWAGARRVALTTGGELAGAAAAQGVPVLGLPTGLQPRAAVGYMLTGALEVATRCGAAPDLGAEVDSACRLLERLAEEWGPGRGSEAEWLAENLAETTVVYGAGSTVPVAVRWKAQLNENAKLAAFDGALPEVDHNEICAWRDDGGPMQMGAVFLEQPDQHPRVRRRIALTAEIVESAGARVERVQARGQHAFERLLSLVMLGDLVSVYRAVIDGVDPTPVEAIERFKRRLADAPLAPQARNGSARNGSLSRGS
jgi:glucose/mannose-6-phosphate isomerase